MNYTTTLLLSDVQFLQQHVPLDDVQISITISCPNTAAQIESLLAERQEVRARWQRPGS